MEQPLRLRAVGYRRVSSKEQTDGHSLDAQEVHIRSYAQSQNWDVTHIYCDAGISAKKDSRRPGLELLMADAEQGKFDVVIVDKIDRFYRHLGGLLVALDELNSHGVFASVQEHLDFTSPWGKLMLTVLGMLDEIYIDNLRQETKKGKRQRAREGLWNGSIPFGYCNGLCSNCTDLNGPG
jgi:site-specific DNA recombinase